MIQPRKKNVTGRASENSMKTREHPKMEGTTFSSRDKNQLQKYKSAVKANLGNSRSKFQKEAIAERHATIHNPIFESKARKAEESDRRLYETKQKIYSAMKKK